MKLRTTAAIFCVVIASLGFTWFQPQQEEKKSSSSDTPEPDIREALPSAPVAEAQAAVSAVKDSLPQQGSTFGGVPASSGAVRQVQDIQTLQPYKAPASAPVSSVNLPIAQQDISPLKDLEVVKIQKQISEIIETNEKFKSLQQSQTDQIRQITEQAQMHRRMLQDLEERNKSPQDLSADDVDEILRQEKMRIIESETEKNKLLLDQLASQQQ